MAKLIMHGPVADVEILEDYDNEDMPVVIKCRSHGFARVPGSHGPCGQGGRAGNYADAVNWAGGHADNGSPIS